MRHLLLSTSAVLACAVTAAAQFPCYETNLGTNLTLGDDQVAANLPLGFSFPQPGGGTTATIEASSNGFIWLGANGNPRCCNGEANKLLVQAPSICPFWTDLNPAAAGPNGGVFFNAFPAAGSAPARAVVTWKDVPEFGQLNLLTFQVQIDSTGAMFFYYGPGLAMSNRTALVGFSEGNANPGGSASWNSVDFAFTTPPIDTFTNPTAFEEMPPWAVDLADRTLLIAPNGQGGYLVSTPPNCLPAAWSTYGAGCPREPVFYELFQSPNTIDLSNTAFLASPNGSGGWTVVPTVGFYTPTSAPIQTGDDYVTGPFALPVPWSWSGGVTSSIDVSSNGFVWLQSGNFNSRCCNGSPFGLLNDPASICGHWMDLNPASGGSVHVDVDPNSLEVHVTWMNVPEYGTSGTSNTFQISLFPTGDFRISFQGVQGQFHDSLTGFSPGAVAGDPGSIDLSTVIPFDTGAGGTPLRLDATAGARPQIGTTFSMDLLNAPASSVVGFMVLGLGQVQPGLDLTPFGMPGCSLFATLDVVQAFPLVPTPQFTWALPNNSALVGLQVYAQGAALALGMNALGLVVSNGGVLSIGI
ncbi:MAG: hypothetical protein JNK15_23920 [Planctomycetes bacterium]|nr:hypothetical protein [Planctomycetota bacterium]